MQNRKSGFIRSGDSGIQDSSKNGGCEDSPLELRTGLREEPELGSEAAHSEPH